MKHVGHSATSYDAAVEIEPDANRLRAMVYGLLMQYSRGLTDHEMQSHLNMIGSTQRPRRVELCDRGLVVDSGRHRLTPSGRKAVVWVIHPVPLAKAYGKVVNA
jgi:hypothetical protein